MLMTYKQIHADVSRCGRIYADKRLDHSGRVFYNLRLICLTVCDLRKSPYSMAFFSVTRA